MYEFDAPGYYDGIGTDEEGLRTISEAIQRQWEWQGPSGGSPRDDWIKAEQKLEKYAYIRAML